MNKEYVINRFVRMANKMGWVEVTKDNWEEEMPYSMCYCLEHILKKMK